MKIIYSFNKQGYEADYWTREISAASDERCTFIPFNHDPYVPLARYLRAQLLDDLFYEKHEGLLRMYRDVQELIARTGADALLVDNCFPYHPEFLRTLDIYKVLRTTDGPASAYDRDFAYVHAYDHVLYHSPAHNEHLGMAEKLRYVGAKRIDFWPLALFDTAFLPQRSIDQLLAQERDVDVVFIGAFHFDKMPLLARLKKALGRGFVHRGIGSWKRKVYYNVKYGFPGWVRPAAFEEVVPLYQRAKIGINVHVRGDYTVGNYRMFDLPANGVMQISDGGEYLDQFFEVGKEIVRHRNDDLVERIVYYLEHDDERKAIARAGYERVLRDHRFALRMQQGAGLIERGMAAR
jgi:hypothetical protein